MAGIDLKAALKYLVELGENQMVTYEIDGKTWVDIEKGSLNQLEPIRYAVPLLVSSLTGLVDYIKSKFDASMVEKNGIMLDGEIVEEQVTDIQQEELLVHIQSPTEVKVMSKLDVDRKRENIISAKATLDEFSYRKFMSAEEFNINILSLFQRTGDAEAILECASSIRIEDSADLKDNGTTQTVTAVQGVQAGKAEVPSPAALRPYRTFLEVEQPESQFIFRINDKGNCALFEADGGMWKYEAMQSIKEYLETALEIEIKEGKIKIIA